MQIKYASTAWNDIKNTKGWFPKFLLLGLIALIPIFGPIVVLGYLYGWARDIAWGIHKPMPKQIFSNEDGSLYRRGFFALVIYAVWLIAISLVSGLLEGSFYGEGVIGSLLSTMSSCVIVMVVFILFLFQHIGSMRAIIYDSLSAGFQLKKIWAMLKYKGDGVLRILGMFVILNLVIGFLFLIVLVILSGFAAISAFAANPHAGESFAAFILAAGAIGFGYVTIMTYVALVANVFVAAMTIRAMGYWIYQFDVPSWRGQDDPMPFEIEQSISSTEPTQDQVVNDASSKPSENNESQTENSVIDSSPIEESKNSH